MSSGVTIPYWIRWGARTAALALGLVIILGSQYIRCAATPVGGHHKFAVFLITVIDSSNYQYLVAISIGWYVALLAVFQGGLRQKWAAEPAEDRGCGGQGKEAGMRLRSKGAKGGALRGFPWPEALLAVGLGWAGLVYGRSYETAYPRADFVTLLAGAALGLAAGIWRLRAERNGRVGAAQRTLLPLLAFLLLAVALFHPDMGRSFSYRGHGRWMGPYFLPNTYGLLMGLGMILAVGLFLKRGVGSREWSGENAALSLLRASAWRWVWAVAFGFMMVGLIKSYSRGAWVGTACGLAYLAYSARLLPRPTRPASRGAYAALAPALAVLLCAGFVLGCLNWRLAENRVLRRVFSVSNLNDFSWRNRVVASIGALQMIWDKPLGGYGWNRFQTAYDRSFRPVTLSDGDAILLNDYLRLAMTVGLPATLCLLAYVRWQFLQGHRSFFRTPGSASAADWDAAVCRSGFVVLAIGFVPENGLFHLALGGPFWILLAMGAQPSSRPTTSQRNAAAARGAEASGVPISTSGRELHGGELAGAASPPEVCLARRALCGIRTFLVFCWAKPWRLGLAAGLTALVGATAFFVWRPSSVLPEPSDPLYQRMRASFLAAQPMAVSVSPNGEYVLTKAEQAGVFKLAVIERKSARTVASTTSCNTQRALTWRPDSQAIAYQETIGLDRPLCLLELRSGKTRRLQAPVSQSALPPLRWSPDGRSLAYFQGDWHKGRLLVIRPEEEDASPTVVAEQVSDTCDFAWSPDGTQLALVTAAFDPGTIVLFRLADRKLSRLPINADGTISEIAWSPDGNSILATVRSEADEYYQLHEVEVRTGRSWLRAAAAGDIGNPMWLADGTNFLYNVLSNGVATVAFGNREHGWVRDVGPDRGVVHVTHSASGGRSVYARYAGLTLPPCLIEIPLDGTEPAMVYAPPRAEETRCPAPEAVSFEAPDGVRIPAYHWAAQDWSARATPELAVDQGTADSRLKGGQGQSPRAVLIVVHGGLHSQTFPTWDAWLKVLLEQGCDVVAVNFRGSSGYGQRFERLGVERERVQDVQAARNYAVNTLKVAPARVFLMGNSHGAGLVAAAAGEGQEIGGLLLVSWVGAVKGVTPRFTKTFPLIEFHGGSDAVLSPRAARVSLEKFVAAADGQAPNPQWRIFRDDGHFFYYADSWTRLYWETMRLMDTK